MRETQPQAPKSVQSVIEELEKSGETTKRHLVLKIEVAAVGEGNEGISISKTRFALISGNQTIQRPVKYASTEFFNFRKRIPVGEPRSGVIAFEVPVGVNPMSLQIAVSKDITWDVFLPIKYDIAVVDAHAKPQ